MAKLNKIRVKYLISFMVVLAGALCILGLTQHHVADAGHSPQQELEAVWERVRRAGSYHFDADVFQTTIPLPKVTNIGRQSRQDAYYLIFDQTEAVSIRT